MRLLLSAWLVLAALPAHASLSGETIDKVADILTIVVIVLVPLVGIVVFWLVHILPEKFAHKRHHPQTDAIQVLCLLSLVFGGLLWPFAWLWAFTKPIGYRMAYGTDKHEGYFDEMAERQRGGALVQDEVLQLKAELESMEARGALPPRLRALKDELARPRLADPEARPVPQGKAA